MKAAIVGTGFIAQTHVRALRTLGVDVVAVAGHSMESAEKFAAQHGIPTWTEDYRMLVKSEPDVVHLCVPPAAHAKALAYFLRAETAVVCEKPLTLDAESAGVLEELAGQQNVPVCVCFNNRFFPAAEEMRRAVGAEERGSGEGAWAVDGRSPAAAGQGSGAGDGTPLERPAFSAGALGKPLLWQGVYEQSFHIPPVADSWRFDAARGNPLRAVTEIGSHLIDLVQFLSGQAIRRVQAQLLRRQDELWRMPDGRLVDVAAAQAQGLPGSNFEVGNEDIALITLQLADGALASLLVSEVSAGKTNALDLTLIASGGRMHWSNRTPDVWEIAGDAALSAGLVSSGVTEAGQTRAGMSVPRDATVCREVGMGTGWADTYPLMLDAFYADVARKLKAQAAGEGVAGKKAELARAAGSPSPQTDAPQAGERQDALQRTDAVGTPRYATLRQAAENVRVCDAVLRSAQADGAWVEV